MASKFPERSARLEMFFKSLNIKRKAFSEKINIQYGVLSQIVNGHVTLTANLVDRIVQAYPNLNADWILRGNGEMILEPNTTTTVTESQPNYGPRAITLDTLSDVIRSLQDQVDSLERDRRMLINALNLLEEQGGTIESLERRVAYLEGIAKKP